MSHAKLTVVHSCNSWIRLTENWLWTQVRFLPEEIMSHIVCNDTQNLDQFPFSTIHSLSDVQHWRYTWLRVLNKLRIRYYTPFLLKIARESGARVLHSHYGVRAWSDRFAVRQAGLKHVVSFYGYDASYAPKRNPRWRSRYQKLFQGVDRVLCEGPHFAKCIINLGCPEEKVRVHHLGIRTEEIPFRPRRWDTKEPLRVLICASFREKKGIPLALEALGRLQHELELEVTIIGDATLAARTRTEKRRILETIDRQGLRKKIRMLGYQPYSVFFEEAYKHHVFLSPSVTAKDGDTEGGLPVSIIEMVASGMPVISTTHCDIPELIKHKVTGLLAEEGNIDDLIRQIRWLIENPSLWNDLTQSGRTCVVKEFDAHTQGKRLADSYFEVVGDEA